MPGTPTIVTSCGSRVSRARSSACVELAELVAGGRRGASPGAGRRRRRRPSAPGRLPRRQPARALPLASIGACSANSIARSVDAVRCLADEDAVHRRRRLDAGGGVDDVARDHALARLGARVHADERLAGVDGEAHLEAVLVARPVADRERRAHGALRVVLVHDRRAEDGHDSVADELLDRAAVVLEDRAHTAVVGGQQRADVLRVEPLGARGRADEVAEDDADDLALLARGRAASSAVAALGAELRASAVLDARSSGR